MKKLHACNRRQGMTNMKMRVGMVGVGGFGSYRRDRMRETGLFEIVVAYDLNPDVGGISRGSFLSLGGRFLKVENE